MMAKQLLVGRLIDMLFFFLVFEMAASRGEMMMPKIIALQKWHGLGNTWADQEPGQRADMLDSQSKHARALSACILRYS